MKSTIIATVKGEEMGQLSTEIGVNSKYLKHFYFCDEKGDKITSLPINDNVIRLRIQFRSIAIGKKCSFSVRNAIRDIRNIIEEDEFTVNNLELTTFEYEYTGKQFDLGATNEQDLYIRITIGKSTYSSKKISVLKTSIAHFIPRIMNANNWEVAYKTQMDWFNANFSRAPWSIEPKLNYINFDWILKFDRINNFYKKNVCIDSNWKKNIPLIRAEIRKYMKKRKIQYPNENNKVVTINLYKSSEVISKEVKHAKLGINVTEKMPEFEDYYFKNVPYTISANEPLDELLAALGSFNFRLSVAGDLVYDEGTIVVKINRIGFFIKDSFDFFNNKEYLGIWNPKENKVEKGALYYLEWDDPNPPFYRVTNWIYNRWQEANGHKFGGHYHLYSNIKEIMVSLEFKL